VKVGTTVIKPSVALETGRERLESLFSRCSADLHRYIRRRLRHASDAADLTQEIFERFMRADRQARARDPRAYLFGIASHVVADAYMAQERDVISYDSHESDKAGEAWSATQGLDEIGLQDELTRALDQLPDIHRAAILLTKREGYSCKEAAARLGTTEGCVRVYVCEARAQLKALLRR
jgi:RNA polymerase sigma-19 factor, ECF subfamily